MITIDPYDPVWPARFDTEAVSIRRSLGELALRVEHVGSTAVPGLAAKPVVDIQVSVPSLAPTVNFTERLSQIGYSHVPLGPIDLVYPFFQKPTVWPSTHHIHLCVAGSEQERKHLAFRDYLRVHPDVARGYAELKRTLAAREDGTDSEGRERYAVAKTEFIERVIALAIAEAGPDDISLVH